MTLFIREDKRAAKGIFLGIYYMEKVEDKPDHTYFYRSQ